MSVDDSEDTAAGDESEGEEEFRPEEESLVGGGVRVSRHRLPDRGAEEVRSRNLLPRLLLQHLSVLLPQLDGDSYLIRNGVVLLLGELLICCRDGRMLDPSAGIHGGSNQTSSSSEDEEEEETEEEGHDETETDDKDDEDVDASEEEEMEDEESDEDYSHTPKKRKQKRQKHNSNKQKKKKKNASRFAGLDTAPLEDTDEALLKNRDRLLDILETRVMGQSASSVISLLSL